jgi:hypothetical protein
MREAERARRLLAKYPQRLPGRADSALDVVTDPGAGSFGLALLAGTRARGGKVNQQSKFRLGQAEVTGAGLGSMKKV